MMLYGPKREIDESDEVSERLGREEEGDGAGAVDVVVGECILSHAHAECARGEVASSEHHEWREDRS